MSEQDYHVQIMRMRDETLRAKITHCRKENEHVKCVKKMYESDPGNAMKQSDKEQMKKLNKEYNLSKENLKQNIDKFVAMMCTTYQSNQENKIIEQRRIIKYMKMWEKAPVCFAELLLRITNNNNLQHVTVNEIITASNFNKGLDSFQLIVENDLVHIVDNETGFKSSPCIACHVSSGSMTQCGYRYVNFLTQSGSVYWGSGTSMDQKSRHILDSKILILTK